MSPPPNRTAISGQPGCVLRTSKPCAIQPSAAHRTIVKTVSSVWEAAARVSGLRPGAAAALSQAIWSGSAVGIDPTLIDDPGNAARQGVDTHAANGEQVDDILGVDGKFV